MGDTGPAQATAPVSPGRPDVTKPPRKRMTRDDDSTRQSLPRSRQSPSAEVQTLALQAATRRLPCPLAPPGPTAEGPPCPARPPTLLATVARLFSRPGTQSCSACSLLSPTLTLSAAASLLHHPLHAAPRAQACHGLPFCLVTLDLCFGPPLRGLPGPSKSPQPWGHWVTWASCSAARNALGTSGELTGGSSCAQGARLHRITSFYSGCNQLPTTQWPRTTQVLPVILGGQEASTGLTALTPRWSVRLHPVLGSREKLDPRLLPPQVTSPNTRGHCTAHLDCSHWKHPSLLTPQARPPSREDGLMGDTGGKARHGRGRVYKHPQGG